MSEPAIVEMVFVELEAKDADCARRDVVEALGDLHLEGWCCEGALPDPERAGLFGVEVFAPPATLPDAGWDIAHALAAHLPRARAEAVLGVSLDEDEARGLSPQAPGNEGFEPFFVAPHGDWHLEEINAPAALKRATGEGVRIGHPDTGTTAHAELGTGRIRVDLGKNLLDDEPGRGPIDPLDEPGQPGHGTATSSLMVSPPGSQLPGSQQPVSGLAPDAEVVPIRVTNTVVILCWQSRLAHAVEHAVAQGCQVISLSLGGIPGSRLARAIRAARAAGVIVVAASGNYVQFVTWPAAYAGVIAVAATGPKRRAWLGSSKGRKIDITAPGASIQVARWEDGEPIVAPGDGTSFSTALVSAAAALWLSFHGVAMLRERYPGALLPDAFRTVLRGSASKDLHPGLFPKSWFGAGFLDCKALLDAPLPQPSEIVPPGPVDDSVEALTDTLVGLSLFPLEKSASQNEAVTPGALSEAAHLEANEDRLRARVGALLEQRTVEATFGEALPIAGAARATLSPSVATELLQRVLLDPALRAALRRSLSPRTPELATFEAPKQASQRLRALFRAPPPEDTSRAAERASVAPIVAVPSGSGSPQPTARLRLAVEIEVRVGAIRVRR